MMIALNILPCSAHTNLCWDVNFGLILYLMLISWIAVHWFGQLSVILPSQASNFYSIRCYLHAHMNLQVWANWTCCQVHLWFWILDLCRHLTKIAPFFLFQGWTILNRPSVFRIHVCSIIRCFWQDLLYSGLYFLCHTAMHSHHYVKYCF